MSTHLVGSNKCQGWKFFGIDVNMFWWNTRRLTRGKISILSIICSCFSTIRCLVLTFQLGHCESYDEIKQYILITLKNVKCVPHNVKVMPLPTTKETFDLPKN